MTAFAVIVSGAAFAQQAATPSQQSSKSSSASSVQQPPAASTAPAIQPPAHPITAAQIKEMQDLSGAVEMKKRIVANAMQYYRSAFPPYIPADVVDDLDKSLQNADLESHAAEIYPKYISTEDADRIIEFYKSPAGHRFIEAQPYMMTEMQRSAIQVAQQTAKDVITRHKAEIDAAQQKYMEEHQQNKPSLNTSPQQNPPASSPQ
jgi:hypothetical protein